ARDRRVRVEEEHGGSRARAPAEVAAGAEAAVLPRPDERQRQVGDGIAAAVGRRVVDHDRLHALELEERRDALADAVATVVRDDDDVHRGHGAREASIGAGPGTSSFRRNRRYPGLPMRTALLLSLLAGT